MNFAHRGIRAAVAAVLLTSVQAFAQGPKPVRRMSNEGIDRASALVDSVFIDRNKPSAKIDGGDWAAYLLARLGSGPLPDSLRFEVFVTKTKIEIRGRMQDLPAEARKPLGPLAQMVDSNTPIVAEILYERTNQEIIRFWLRRLKIDGIPFPEIILVPMMASVGSQYPELSKTGRDLFIRVPVDSEIALGNGVIEIAIKPKAKLASNPPVRKRR